MFDFRPSKLPVKTYVTTADNCIYMSIKYLNIFQQLEELGPESRQLPEAFEVLKFPHFFKIYILKYNFYLYLANCYSHIVNGGILSKHLFLKC